MKQKNKVSKRLKKNIFVILTVFLVILGFTLYKVMFKSKSTYTVVNGYVEKISDVTGIVLKDETIIKLSNETSAVPVIEQGKRVSKYDVIATYKSDSYESYLNEIEQVDKDIESLVKDLPATYSVDISNIEEEITNLTKQAQNTTSYLKMQEYKSKIDELSYKKVLILGELSPTGSKIRELIEKRQQMELSNNSSSDNIKSTKPGVVTYKIDNLENIFDFNDVLDFSTKDIDTVFQKYSENNSNNFGIKIVDNYLAYFVIKLPKNEHEEYIEEGYRYIIKTNEKESDEFVGTLIKIQKSDNENYLMFKITDGIEKIVDHRTINLEIIWDKTEGMAIVKNAIKRNEQDTYDYVTVVNGGEYLNVPIKVVSSNEGVCIVRNFTQEEKEELGLADNKSKLSLYDVLVIE